VELDRSKEPELCGNCRRLLGRRPVKCMNETPCEKRVCQGCATDWGPYCREHALEAGKNGE
jgi:hypothetical protein